MARTTECRVCGTITISSGRCEACDARRPGRDPRATYTILTLVVLILLAAAVAWAYAAGLVGNPGLWIVAAAATGALFRVFVPRLVPRPRIVAASLVGKIQSLQARVDGLNSQLSSLADAYKLARARGQSRLIAITKSKLQRSYGLLKRYRDRFDANLQLLLFSLWMIESSALIAGWSDLSAEELELVYNRLSGRIDNCRVRFAPFISGKSVSDIYRATVEAIQIGLRRADLVADAMVARKAQLALASVSPASHSFEPLPEPLITGFATDSVVKAADALEHEFDRILAEQNLTR